MRLTRGVALLLLPAALAACGSSEGQSGITSFAADYGWTCASGTNCQDVFDLDLFTGSALTIRVSNVSSGSVAQLALYGPGVALGGVNLLTTTTNELRCAAGTSCSDFTGGETVTAFAITQSGRYRLAVTRDWGNSCGGTGTYRLQVSSSRVFGVVGQSVEDQASQAGGFECH